MSAVTDSQQTPGAQILRLYLVVLGRRPDRAGLDAYVGHLQGGQTLEEIAVAFVASDEFLAVAGGEPAPVVLYRNAHGALPSSEWLAANRLAPDALAAAFVRDPAVALRLPAPLWLDGDADPWALTAQVVRLYLVVLARPPDAGGLASYVGHCRAGLPLEDIAEVFIESDEFRDLAGGEAVAVVLHRNALGTAPPPGWPGAKARSPGAVAAALVADPTVVRRLSALGALHPDGLPLDDAALYRRWLGELARPDAVERRAMQENDALPGVSWIMLLDNPTPVWLDAAVASVRAQPAPGTELLLVCGRGFCATALRHAREDTRVRLVRGLPWEWRARLLGRALAAAGGEFVGVLGQHDLLHETAGYEVAAAAVLADVVVGDEDAVDSDGLRHSPRFGALRHPDALLAEPRPGVVVARASLLRAAGWPGNGAAPERDLVARVLAGPEPVRLRHVPVVLRSRRDPPMPAPPSGVPWARTGRVAGRVAGRAWKRAVGPAHGLDKAARGVFSLPKAPPLASIIVATRDRAALLQACLHGVLERTDYPAFEVLVLDNGSREADALALLDRLASDSRVRVLSCEGAFNWSALNNRGVREQRGEVAVLLNNDTEVVATGWLGALVSQALRPEVGIAGAKLLYPDRSVQHAGMVLGPAGGATHMWRHSDGEAAGYMDQLVTVRDVAAVTGACVALRRAVFERVGGLEEALPVTWSDVELCLKVRAAGLRVVWTPQAVLLHREQASRGTDETPDGQARLAREKAWMLRRWGEAMDVDPFLSPNMLPGEARALLAPVPRRVPPWQKAGGRVGDGGPEALPPRPGAGHPARGSPSDAGGHRS